MKASFQIKAKNESIITEKGVRTFVMEMLLNSPFSKGAVFNVDEKTVEVWIEGDEKQIKKFRQELEKALFAKLGNPAISFTDLSENPLLEIPELMRSSQALALGQLSKGVGVQLHILETLKELKTELKNLPTEIAKAIRQ